jgi:dihydroorotate dehydrogenase (NAD+) catalytic subunit
VIEADGIRRCLAAGAAAVVVKSANESELAKEQLERSEYTLFNERWEQIPWGRSAPPTAMLACRSGTVPMPFDAWLEQTAMLDREARQNDAYVIASLILSQLEPAKDMARKVEQAGIRVLEFNVGVPYASQTKPGNVTTELVPDRISESVKAIRASVSIPVWVKTTGQSERVPALASAAFGAGADAVIMAGRLLGFIPDVETLTPFLGSSLGISGFWNLPITCHWLTMTRKAVGKDKPLIGINGVQSGLDVARFMLEGASAVEIASPVQIRGYDVLADAVAEFARYLERKGLNARDLVGVVADQHRPFMEMPLKVGNWRNYIPA